MSSELIDQTEFEIELDTRIPVGVGVGDNVLGAIRYSYHESVRQADIRVADLLVTSCPACMIQLSYGVRRHGLKTKVCHISQVVTGQA